MHEKSQLIHPKAHRLIDLFFVDFLAKSDLHNDFSKILAYIQTPNDITAKGLNNLFEIATNVHRSPRKSIPKSPSAQKRRHTPVRRSYDNSARLLSDKGSEIPVFHHLVHTNTTSILSSLLPKQTILSLPEFQSFLKSHLQIPSFFALPLAVRLFPEIAKTHVFEISFSRFLEYAIPHLEHQSIPQRFFAILLGKHDRSYLEYDDFVPYITILLKTHKSLTFLKSDADLQSTFIQVIIARIFYALDPQLRNRITYQRFANSNLCDCFMTVDDASDISDVSDFFSYEHFYVIYSLFYELDENEEGHPLVSALYHYDDQRINPVLIDRLIDQLKVLGRSQNGTFSLIDFVYFINAIEDKSTETAQRLWFRVLDLDDDGVLSMSEIESLYEDQLNKMERQSVPTIPFEHVLSQMLDMLGTLSNGIPLADFHNSTAAVVLINALADLKKFLRWEFRDPVYESSQRARYPDMHDFDIFCQDEYQRLSREAQE